MKQVLNVFALVLGLLLYPISFSIINKWAINLTLSQLFIRSLYYSYYLVVSWDYYVIFFLFLVGIVIGAVTKISKSEIKMTVFYYLLLATLGILFYIVFKDGLTTLTSFNGRLYILAFYILIFRNGIFSLLGAIVIKKLSLPTNRNKKMLQNENILTQTVCPHCGSVFKSNPIICTHCGGVIDSERYALLHKEDIYEHLVW